MVKLFNPWNFAKDLDLFYSPDSNKWVVYTDLRTLDDTGLLAGTLALFASSNGAIISRHAGGLPVWDKEGKRVIFPVWFSSLLIGQYQRLMVVDTVEQTITALRHKFRVVFLEKFEGNMVTGKDLRAGGMRLFQLDLLSAKSKRSLKYCAQK